MALYEFLIIWYLIGLLTSIIVVYINWYLGDDIEISELPIVFLFAFFGPMLFIIAFCVLVSKFKWKIKGRKQR